MTRIHLLDITLAPLPASGHTFPANTRLIAEVLDDDEVIVRSEPVLWSESERSWTFEIKSDMPQSCSYFAINITDSSPDQSLICRFGLHLIELKDIVSSASGEQDSSLTTQITASIDFAFRLCATFTIRELLVFPLNGHEIRDTVRPMLSEEMPINAYDLAIVCDSVRHLQITDRNRSHLLNLIGDIYMKQYDMSQSVSGLTKAIDMYHQALRDAIWSDDQMLNYMFNYGSSLLDRYEELRETSDLNDSVTALSELVQLAPDDHPDKPFWLNILGNSLLTRFEKIGEVIDLNDSVVKFQEAVQLIPDGNPDKPSQLNSLGNSLLTRFGQLGEVNDLKDSIVKFQEVVQLTHDDHPNKPSWLNNLGDSLLRQFEQLGNVSNLNDAVVKYQEAVQLTPGDHPDRPSWLNNLGHSLLTRFEQFGDLNDLKDSVVRFQEAVDLTPDGHPEKPSWLNNLGSSLLIQFEQHGDVSNLNDSVVKKQEALLLTPDGHPAKSSRLNNLGNSLLARFGCLGEVNDLTNSVDKFQEAVQLAPNGHPDKPSWLNNLGSSLLRQFEQLRDIKNLNDSIVMLQEAVQLTPDGHLDKPSWLNNLGNSLLTRFEQLGEINDLNDSSIKFQEAVQLTPDDHPDKPSWLNNFGSSLLTQFEQLGDVNNLNNSIMKFQEAVQLTPDGHPAKSKRLNNLGKSLLVRFLQLKLEHDMRDAILAFSSATHAKYGAPLDQLCAANLWAMCLRVLNDPPDCILEPYHAAIPLLSEVAWLGSSLPDRHKQIMKADNIVHEAAAIAFKANDYSLAVKWLEQGRSVIWAQLLQLRTPLDDLDVQEPTLSQQLRYNSSQLEDVVSKRQVSAMNDLALLKEDIAGHAHRLAQERKELLAEIRKQPGFENFLLLKDISKLTPAASYRPIVILTLSELDCTCCAFILPPNLPHDVVALKLESFPPSKAKHLYSQLKELLHPGRHINTPYDDSNKMAPKRKFISRIHSAVNDSTNVEEALASLIIDHQNDKPNENYSRDGNPLPVPPWNATGHGLKAILAELWECVAQPILKKLAITISSSENKPRLWWCPTGILSFLPLHAAGLYNKGAAVGSKLSDFVISSYIPMLSVLLDATTQSSSLLAQPRLLAVAQSSSNNQMPLPGALEEIKYIEEAVERTLPMTILSEENATLEKVVSNLKTSNWVHFACHGVQNMTHPTESALLLAGNDQLTLAKLSTLQIAHGDIAFLSACQTAMGNEQLSDEAVHLGAGMLVAGYRGVIATMWSVTDHVAPQVALDVYRHLVLSNSNPAEAAHALHLAVQKIRGNDESEDDTSLMSWVPFIHLGK